MQVKGWLTSEAVAIFHLQSDNDLYVQKLPEVRGGSNWLDVIWLAVCGERFALIEYVTPYTHEFVCSFLDENAKKK